MDKIDLHQGMALSQVFYTEWKRYQDQIREAIAPLRADQLRLRATPHQCIPTRVRRAPSFTTALRARSRNRSDTCA